MTDGSGPVALGAQAPVPGALDRATQERLLDATDHLVQRIGIDKTSMADVARTAGVARGTLYRYFESRGALFDAMTQRTTDRFFDDVAAAMDRRPDLSAQLGEFSEIMMRTIHPEAETPPNNQAALARMLATQGAQALVRTAKFLRPYIEAARARGEVRADLDLADASEWLARILLSFTVLQASISYQAGDPRSVSSFVQRYAIGGLTSTPA